MTDKLTLAAVDKDGAIEEALERIDGEAAASRGIFLKKGALLTGGVVGGGALLGAMAAPAGAQTQTDVAIFNFALTLEYLEAAFYTEAVRMGALSGRTDRFARVVGAHERAHVAAIKKTLGSAAVASPSFDFQGTTENAAQFRATAQVLEDTGVMAYAGQAPRINTVALLKSALAIHTVEARHASWIRRINNAPPAPVGFDQPKTMEQILAAVGATGFITTGTTMSSSGQSPSFTG